MDENTNEEKAVEPININVEIDYEKLATAIVSAQEKAKEIETETEVDIPLWKKLISWFNPFQKRRNEKMTVSFFALICGGACWFIGLMGLFFFIPVVCLSFENIIAFILTGEDWFWKIYKGVLIVLLLILIFGLFVLLTGMGAEIMTSRDKHFVVAVFSALSGFIALIVALIALFV